MPQKQIAVISHDYDGCLDIYSDKWLEQQINLYAKRVLSARASEAEINAFKKKCRAMFLPLKAAPQKAHEEFLKKITKAAEAVEVYVGSDRQSYDLDKLNADNNRTGSVFPVIEQLCEDQGEKWKFIPLLLADPEDKSKLYGRKAGEAYKLIQSGVTADKQLKVAETQVKFLNKQGKLCSSKRNLLLTQMWDAYHRNPGAKINMHFIDDREDLIDEIVAKLRPEQMPPNVTLNITLFDYTNSKQFHKTYAPIKGSAFIMSKLSVPHKRMIMSNPVFMTELMLRDRELQREITERTEGRVKASSLSEGAGMFAASKQGYVSESSSLSDDSGALQSSAAVLPKQSK